MTPHRSVIILFVISIIFIIVAGCTTLFPGQNVTPAVTIPAGEFPVDSYKVTIHQPDATSSFIHMDTDVYNIGEVVEFTVRNDGSRTLDCAGDPPKFSVKFQGINGAWGIRMGNETPDNSQKSSLGPGASTTTYRFVTEGWAPGRYRIVHDCGVVREFILRPVPTLAATPVEITSPNETVNATIAIPINSTTVPGIYPSADVTGTLPPYTPAHPSTSSHTTGTGILSDGQGMII
ncbi:hypothetical protein [Methanoregula sp.]|jgi:archaellum component FlaF (FlaF/FlaG flagellin family)|uniref:hypothetical protein n=1 Tax=Methanoregula sp. TaxID=2052170 RepID=UPI003C2A2BB3